MKKPFMILACTLLSVSLASCGASGDQQVQSVINDQTLVDNNEKWLEGEELFNTPLEGELTIYSYDAVSNQSFLEEAAAAFEAEHPGTKINLRTFSKMPETKTTTLEDGSSIVIMTSDNDPQAKNDYISTINTELMQGGGPDILSMDIIPYYKYAESGYLENLSNYMNYDDSFNMQDYWPNLFESVQYKGGQFILPISYSFSIITYYNNVMDEKTVENLNQKTAYTYDDLVNSAAGILNNATDNKALIEGIDVLTLFSILFELNYDNYIDIAQKRANFNDGSFVHLLEELKQQNENGYFMETVQNVDFDSIDMNEFFRSEPENQFLFGLHKDYVLSQIFSADSESNFSFSSGSSSTMNSADSISLAGRLTGDDGQYSFQYRQAYGINSNSQNKRLAWEFIKYLLSTPAQTSVNQYFMPVNMSAFDIIAKREMMTLTEYDETGVHYTDLLGDQYIKAYEDYVDAVKTFTSAINTFYIIDEILNDIVYTEADSFFNGDKSAQEVADILQNKIELYLNE